MGVCDSDKRPWRPSLWKEKPYLTGDDARGVISLLLVGVGDDDLEILVDDEGLKPRGAANMPLTYFGTVGFAESSCLLSDSELPVGEGSS